MKCSILLLIFQLITLLIPSKTLALSLAGTPASREIVDKPPEFLKVIGVTVDMDYGFNLIPDEDSDSEKPDLIVRFSTTEHSDYPIQTTMIVLLNPQNEISLSIGNPFPPTQHLIRYDLPKGYSLVIVIEIDDDTRNVYKITISN